MIIRLSAKLSKKLKCPVSEALPQGHDQLADWSANLFTAHRTQYIIVTNTATLYSVVFEGKGITTAGKFIDAFADCIANYLRFDGHTSAYVERIEPLLGDVRYSKASNRSVIGSMDDLVKMAKGYIGDGSASLLGVSSMLNRSPMSYLKYSSPDRDLKSAVEASSVQR